MAAKRKPTRRLLVAAELSDKDLKKAVKNEISDIHPIDAIREVVARNPSMSPALLRERLSSAIDEETRASSAAALGTRKTPTNCKALLTALKDESPEVVRRAAQSLGRIGGRAELEALRKLRPRHPALKRSVTAAKTLLSYRLGERRGLLKAPEQDELLPLGASKANTIEVKPSSLKELGLAERLARDIPELRISDQALGIVCDRWSYLVVFDRNMFRKNAAALAAKSNLFGILLRSEQIDDRYYRYAYLLTHPDAGKKSHVFAMRNSAEIAYYGHIVQTESGALFDIQAMNTRHTRPIEFSGTISPQSQSFTDIRALVGVEKDPGQPAPKQPRRIRLPMNQ